MKRREYRRWLAAYRYEIGTHTWITPPNALVRHPNRFPKRWLPRLRLRITPR